MRMSLSSFAFCGVCNLYVLCPLGWGWVTFFVVVVFYNEKEENAFPQDSLFPIMQVCASQRFWFPLTDSFQDPVSSLSPWPQ